MNLFCNDHDGLVPHPMGDDMWVRTSGSDRYKWLGYNAYGADPAYPDNPRDKMVPWIARKNMPIGKANLLFDVGNYSAQIGPLGVMAAFGYIDTPEKLYCPDFKRPPEYVNNQWEDNYYVDKHSSVWKALTDGDGVVPRSSWTDEQPMASAMKAGIVHYLAYRGFSGSYQRSPDRYSTLHNYSMWEEDDRISPMMFSCANITDGGGWNMMQYSEQGISHEAKGVNGAFYDGSARWIPLEEVQEDGMMNANHPDWLTNDSAALSNLQSWAKEHLTVRQQLQ
jgi:hypothetical protein